MEKIQKIMLNIFITLVNIMLAGIAMLLIFYVIVETRENIITIGVLMYILLILMFILFSYKLIYKSKKLIGVGIYFMVLAFIVVIPRYSDSLQKIGEIDTCLDFGGRWDYKLNKCEGSSG
ncbi:MAG: hypothetical protein GY793_04165 [Proteobacteria bacterium]|nr:hypothetical protein [Pseudomonadota bacterium]